MQLPFGKYSITEIEAPEGYNQLESPIIIEFRADENHEFTIENEAKAKVITNHYKAIKNADESYTYTEEKVAESYIMIGNKGENYTTVPHLDLEKYQLIKDENGKYVIPENATGTIELENIIINYYYEEKEIPLIVHHYIEGTEEKVPLKDGTKAEDETGKGKENEEYTTEAISDELLSEQYELVEMPKNAKGIYTGEEVTVTYYYKKAKRELELNKYSEDGTTPLGGVKFTITPKEENSETSTSTYITNSQGKIKLELEVGKYEITEIEVPEGYQLPEEATTEIEITKETEKAEIEITNTKKRGTVITHHYIEGTENKVPKEDGTVVEDEIQTGIVGEAFATKVSDEVPVYYEFVSSSKKTSGEYLEETQEVIYYYRLKEYNYTVEYYYNEIEDETKQETSKAIYENEIEEYTDKVKDGYKLERTENLPLTITENEKENVIKVYYIKRQDLSYMVNYLEKDTNKVISTQKVAENQVFESVIEAEDEKIEIEGYNYDSSDKESITIGTTVSENVINLYYIKREDLSYIVNYLEKGTNKVISTQKVVANQVFESVIEATNEKIEIDGYNYDSSDKESITIQIDSTKNIINIYYTKCQDLKYTVNYLEKDTNKVLHEPKEQENQEFQKVITSSDEIISIDGYKYDSSDKENITIQVDETKNVINLYYTKRNDLKYTVNYLEKGTDKVLHEPKIQENQTFEAVITSSNEVIEIPGYKYDSVDKKSITIQVDETENVINIYYISKATKYTVNYLEEDTNNILHEAKIENSQQDKIITTEDEILEIEGYEYSSSSKQSITLVLDETENIINIYYIKRSDLRYTVNYLEKDTNEILHEQKIVENQVFGGIIKSSTEVIEIPGYNYDSSDKESITIQVDETKNIINIYYTKRTDIKYTVEYYYGGIKDENETEEYTATYKETIEEYEDKIRENYVLVEEKGIPLTIEVDESKNIIQIYYITKAQAKVQYIDKITKEIIEERIEEGYVGKEFKTEAKDFEGYILVEEPEEKTVPMEEEEIVLKYYYIHVSSGVIEKHIDIETDEILYNTTHKGNEGDEYKTEPKEFENYDLVEDKYPENAEGTMKKEVVTVNYYYRKREPITITVKYIDKETKEEIEETVIITDYEGKEYKTEQKEIEGYEFIEVKGETEGKITEEKEIIYYYQKIKEPEIPGEGGDDPVVDEPKDDTTIDKEIPSAGLTKEQIAIIVVTTMVAITGIIVTIGIKGIKLDKKH